MFREFVAKRIVSCLYPPMGDAGAKGREVGRTRMNPSEKKNVLAE